MVLFGFDYWFVLFGCDFVVSYGEDGVIDFVVVIMFSCYVECLFWSFGIYCWFEGDDVCCVVFDWLVVLFLLLGIDIFVDVLVFVFVIFNF